MQKFLLFPIYLNRVSPEDNFYSAAMIKRIEGGRIFSIFSLPTLYAIICAVLIFFVLHYLVSVPPGANSFKRRLFWGVILVAGLFNLMLTQSFGGIIYLTVGGIVYLLLAGILKLKYLIPTSMVLLLFLSLVVALRISEVKRMEPVKLRFSNWLQATRIIGDHPFWGVGLGNYESQIAAYTYPDEARSIYAHNFFLQFIAETGLFLPLLILIFLFLARKKLKPCHYQNKIVYITIATVLLIYNFIDIGFYFFSAAVAFVVVLSQIYPYRESEPNMAPVSRWHSRVIFGIFFLLAALLLLETLSDSQRNSADFLSSQKEYGGAIVAYKKSMALNPFNFKAQVGYAALPIPAQVDSQQGKRVAEAVFYLDRALLLNPDSPFANYLKSRFLFQKKQYLSALYFAYAAQQKNKLLDEYKTWLTFLRGSLIKTFQPGNTPEQGKIK